MHRRPTCRGQRRAARLTRQSRRKQSSPTCSGSTGGAAGAPHCPIPEVWMLRVLQSTLEPRPWVSQGLNDLHRPGVRTQQRYEHERNRRVADIVIRVEATRARARGLVLTAGKPRKAVRRPEAESRHEAREEASARGPFPHVDDERRRSSRFGPAAAAVGRSGAFPCNCAACGTLVAVGGRAAAVGAEALRKMRHDGGFAACALNRAVR